MLKPQRHSFWERARHEASERVAGLSPPRSGRPLVRVPWTRVVVWLLLLLGFAVQLVVIEAVFELVDLTLSLMELWAELARKHLELTL
jgi:hypothetical protein